MRALLLVWSLGLLMAEKAQAQIWIRNSLCGPVFPAYSGVGFSFRVGGLSLSGYSGFANYGYLSPFAIGPTIVQKNIIWDTPWGLGWANRGWWSPPAFVGPVWAGPAWGWPWAFDPVGLPVWAPPGVLVPAGLAPLVEREPVPQRPIDRLDRLDRPIEPAPLARRTLEAEPEFDERRFIVIRPSEKPQAPEVIAAKPQFPKIEPAPKVPAIEVPAIEVPILPVVAVAPEKDMARVEQDRLEETGRVAFANRQYGRAAERFRKSSEQNPKEASPLFHLAQAYVALGKYREASETIQKGLQLRPDWADSVFSPRNLYKNPNDYDEHLQSLIDLQKEFRHDPDLTFVLAYQLWFDGKRAQAQALFAELPKEFTLAFLKKGNSLQARE